MKKILKLFKKQNVLYAFLLTVVCLSMTTLTAHAAPNQGAEVVRQGMGNFTDVISAIVSSFGTILLLWGMLEWGTALQSQNGSEQALAFKRIGGGIVCALGPAVVAGLV